MIIAGLIVVVPYLLVTIVGGRIAGGSLIGSLTVSILANIVIIVGGAVIARGALDVASGEPFDFGAAFGKINVANVIIASIIVSVLVAVGLILLVIPGVVAAFLTYFTQYFIVDDQAVSPIEAIGNSVKLVSANVGDSLLLAVLNLLVLVAGAIALGVGLLVAYPVVILASAYAYRKFHGQPVAA